MKKLILVLCIIIICFSGCLQKGDNTLKYDNDILADAAISKVYSEKDIEELKSKLKLETITYSEIESLFKVECIRKTFQGYYIVLKIDDGGYTFLFIDTELKLSKIISADNFYSKSDFDFVECSKTTASEISGFDSNTIYYPVSYLHISGHILSDGIIIIEYDRYKDDILLNDPIVKSVKYISNNDIERMTDDFYVRNTPFILDIDKAFD